jgi:hypothetical protein
MPVLNQRNRERQESAERGIGWPAAMAGAKNALLQQCSNPACSAGWLRVWRSRSVPVFEGGWSCSAECTANLVSGALRREMDGRTLGAEEHRHRIPLGLLMVRQGWITQSQLRQALEAQRAAGGGRLGHWLVRQQGVSGQLVTRALALQWGCPVLASESLDIETGTVLVPRLFADAFGALPLRLAAGRILYLGFVDRLDPVLALAIERMTGLRAECGIVQESAFRAAHARLLEARFPRVELLEASSEAILAEAIAARLEKAKPVESRLVRVHDCLWLRMWRRPQHGPVPDHAAVEDLIASVRPA